MVSGEGLDAHVKTGGESQEDRDRMGRGTGGGGGQAELVESCRPMCLRRRLNQEPGTSAKKPSLEVACGTVESGCLSKVKFMFVSGVFNSTQFIYMAAVKLD